MATTDWQIPTGKEITGATYIKDTDDKIAATIEDLVDWCNNANGTYNDWTLTGLRTDFVDVNTAQTITAVKTIDTLGAVDFTGGELRIGGVAVTSTAAELNILDGVTATTADINKTSNIIDGIITSGTWTPTTTVVANALATSAFSGMYERIGDIVTCYVKISVTPDSISTLTKASISLPIASNLTTADTDLLGSAISHSGFGGATIKEDLTNDRAEIWFTSVLSGSPEYFYCSFRYKII